MTEARELWNARYRDDSELYGAEPNQFLQAELAGWSPRRVLDLGCGQGRNAVWLAMQGHRVTGLDLSDVAIGQARELAARAGVEIDFHAVDVARSWMPDPEYDLVLLSYLQLPGRTRRAVHRKAVDALAPGGTLFLVAHHRDNLEHGVGGPPMPEVLFDESMLASDFEELVVRRNEKILRYLPTGHATRPAHDIILVADKPCN